VKSYFSYFKSSFLVAGLGLVFGCAVGYAYSQTWEGALTALLLTFVLSVLEISLSVDNAVVNASILRVMTPRWRHRFITWGMLIAVFGMRIVFPLVIVSGVARINPWEALKMATTRPSDYAAVMLSSHVVLAGFGATFLLMVCLRYFFDEEKHVHWLPWIERSLTRLGKIRAIEMALCLLLVAALSFLLHDAAERFSFQIAGCAGLLTFGAVDMLTKFLNLSETDKNNVERASAAMFIYLEILDASFSFDGVIGAFALTYNLFIIATGLGIGAMFVRSLTILLVEKETISEFRYLEHGAFYAIGALGLMMLVDVFINVPDAITGLAGGLIIGLSLVSSVRYRRQANAAH
jgi:hypothetical protein